MQRVVRQQRLSPGGDNVVSGGCDRGMQCQCVSAGRFPQRTRPAEPPPSAAHQPPCQSLHGTRVEEVEHTRWKCK